MRNGNLLKSDLWNLRKTNPHSPRSWCICHFVHFFSFATGFINRDLCLSMTQIWVNWGISAWLKYESTEAVKFYKNRSCVKFLAKCIWLAAILLMGQNPTLFTSGYFCHHYCTIVEDTLFVWDKYTNVNRDVQFEELVWKINYAHIIL